MNIRNLFCRNEHTLYTLMTISITRQVFSYIASVQADIVKEPSENEILFTKNKENSDDDSYGCDKTIVDRVEDQDGHKLSIEDDTKADHEKTDIQNAGEKREKKERKKETKSTKRRKKTSKSSGSYKYSVQSRTLDPTEKSYAKKLFLLKLHHLMEDTTGKKSAKKRKEFDISIDVSNMDED
ncbi:hypothetical protein COBT_003530, partial [Conglomerata obtusa]